MFGGDLSGNRAVLTARRPPYGRRRVRVEIGFNYAPSSSRPAWRMTTSRRLSLMGNLIVGVPVGSTDAGRPRAAICNGRRRTLPIQHHRKGSFSTVASAPTISRELRRQVYGLFQRARRPSRRHTIFPDADRRQPWQTEFDFDFGDLNFWKWDVGAAFKF